MENRIIFNVGLLLEDAFNKEIVTYSQRLNQVRPAFYSLGGQSLPHITILQFWGREDEAQEIWKRIHHLSQSKLNLNFIGLNFERFNQWNCIWARVRRTKELENLQFQTISALGHREYLNGIGESYDPHATLLAWPEESMLPPFPIDTSILYAKDVKAFLTLGKSGPQFQYAECLRK